MVYSIAAQVSWLNIGYEVLSEALLIPLAFLLGQVISEKRAYELRVSTSLVIVILFYLIVTALVLMFTPKFVIGMKQDAHLIIQTVEYIRLESIAILLSSVFGFFSLVLVLKDNQRALYTLLILQTVLTLIGDSMFASQLPLSLTLGVNGIATTNILVNLSLSVVSIIYLTKDGFRLRHIQFQHQNWIKVWFKIGSKSGLESFVRNFAFLVMILQLINQVQQSGVYWVTNNFIWGWLLLPILALGQLIKQDTATSRNLTHEKINAYIVLSLVIICFWLASMPLWDVFILTVIGVTDPGPIVQLAGLLIGFYAVFAFNNVIDSYFYGLGRTDLMLYQSLIVNILFYGGAYIAYQVDWFIPSLETIALMFGFALLFDAVLTLGLYIWLRNTERQKPSLSNVFG